MKAIDIIVIVLSALIVIGVIVKSVIDRKHGKCSCDCEGCAYKSSCKKTKQK